MSTQKTNRELIHALENALQPISWWQKQSGSPLKRRLMRASRYPIKSSIYAFSKLFPWSQSSKTFFDSKIHHHMPEHFYFYFFGFFVNDTTEAGLTKFILRHVKEGDTILDIGANCGLYTLLGSKLVGTQGHVHSFEPTTNIFNLLQKSTQKLGNVRINNRALLDVAGTSTFYKDEKYSVANSIERTSDTQVASEVVTDTLDAYCTRNVVTPDFIKLDAEGSESKILKGGLQTIGKCHPVIAMEILHAVEEVGHGASDILFGLGYNASRIENDGSLTSVTAHDIQSPEIYKGEGFVNVLFQM